LEKLTSGLFYGLGRSFLEGDEKKQGIAFMKKVYISFSVLSYFEAWPCRPELLIIP
jgi:hypothetical protein